MKILLEIYPKRLKKYIYRKIEVNSDIRLDELCEYIIVSLNGNCKHLYRLIINEEDTYLGKGCTPIMPEENMMNNLLVEDINIDTNDQLLLNYDFNVDWEFIIEVKRITDGYYEKDFSIIDGYGVGIIEDIYNKKYFYDLYDINTNYKKRKEILSIVDENNEYQNSTFNIIDNNYKIIDYKERLREKVKHKNYIMNVNLEGLSKEIKRKIAVDSNVSLSTFCECIIYSMNGDLSHGFGIRINGDYLDDEIIKYEDLNFLELKEKQKFTIIYDWGDNWHFKVTVSKINDDYGKKKFEVLKTTGKGIKEDCGGVWGLVDLINDKDNDWDYDIDDYNLEEINNIVDNNYL